MSEKIVVLSLLAHPDDAELLCAGTLLRLAQEHQAEIHIATFSVGECGSHSYDAQKTASIRRQEAQNSAAFAGATYHCLDQPDLGILYSPASLLSTVLLMRQLRPNIVLAHSPVDYSLDHEQSSLLARAACFAAPVPNYPNNYIDKDLALAGSAAAMETIPHLYYCDALEGKDNLGRSLPPSICVDIDSVVEGKAQMLACHRSQFEWIAQHHRHSASQDLVATMRAWGRTRGELIGSQYAEGFRQHKGHAYPQNDLLGDLLGCWPAE